MSRATTCQRLERVPKALDIAKYTELGNIAKYTKSGTEKKASSKVVQA